MRKRSALLVVVVATVLTLASSFIRGDTLVNYPDVDGCTTGCTVAAAGWPFPYLADYPGVSPGGSTSLVEAVTGSDHVLWTAFVASWLAWVAAIALLAYLGRRRHAPHKHKRHRH